MKALESTRGEENTHTPNTTTPIEKGGERDGLTGRDLELSSIYSEDFLDTDSVGGEKGVKAIESEETGGEKVSIEVIE